MDAQEAITCEMDKINDEYAKAMDEVKEYLCTSSTSTGLLIMSMLRNM